MRLTRRGLLGSAFAGTGSAALSGRRARGCTAGGLAAAGCALDHGRQLPRLRRCHHHGDGRNVKFVEGRDGKSEGAALFNGVDAVIEVKHQDELRFGTQEFSISTWINVKQDLESVIGDVLTKFDRGAQA